LRLRLVLEAARERLVLQAARERLVLEAARVLAILIKFSLPDHRPCGVRAGPVTQRAYALHMVYVKR
jgi:hypothetical protein